jgi:hypothetical protein
LTRVVQRRGRETAQHHTHLSLFHLTWTMICPDAFSACARRKGLKNDTLSARATSKGETTQVGVSMVVRVEFDAA